MFYFTVLFQLPHKIDYVLFRENRSIDWDIGVFFYFLALSFDSSNHPRYHFLISVKTSV